MAIDLSTNAYINERISPCPDDPLYLHLSDLLLVIRQEAATSEQITLLDYGCGGSPNRSLFPNACYVRADVRGYENIDLEIAEDGSISAEPGSFVWARRIIPGLIERGVDVHVASLCFCPAGEERNMELQRFLTNLGIRVHSVGHPGDTTEAVRWLLSVAEAIQPDVFVANCVVPAFYAGQMLVTQGRKTVIVLHSDDEFHHDILRLCPKVSPATTPSAFVAVSRTLEKLANDALSRRALVERIPYGVPLAPIPAKSHNVLILLYAGRFVIEQKRVIDVARALAAASAALSGVRGVMCGDGPQSDAVRRVLKDIPGGDRVTLLGALDPDQVRREMLTASCVVLLSDYEGLPIALMEGMACGLVPIVTEMRSGISELVRHEVNGLVVPDRGPGFVAAVRRLHDDPAMVQRLGAAARRTIEEAYSDQFAHDRWRALIVRLSASVSPNLPAFKAPTTFTLPPIVGALGREDWRPAPPTLVRRLRSAAGGAGLRS